MPVTFSSEAAKKIKQATLKVLGTPEDRTHKALSAAPPPEDFWAWITSAADITGQRYHWVRVFPAFEDDDPDLVLDTNTKWKIFQPAAFGHGTAYEANGARGIVDAIVKLSFAGYRKPSPSDEEQVPTPVYVFNYQTFDRMMDLPLHDHRDNLTGGGFAFAVYHPGTSLPQQPWHL